MHAHNAHIHTRHNDKAAHYCQSLIFLLHLSPLPASPSLHQRPAEQCRYAVGSILCEGDEAPDAELQELYEKHGFRVFTLPEVTHAVTSSFPSTTPLSHVLGPYRVYPELSSYIEVGAAARTFAHVR